MIRVLDASVVVKWFVPEDEPSTRKACAILDEVLLSTKGFAVPELLYSECLHVFGKRLSRQDDIDWAMSQLFRLAITPLRFDAAVARAAARALAAGLTGYDATYYAFAEQLGGKWVTFDRSAWDRAPDKNVVDLL